MIWVLLPKRPVVRRAASSMSQNIATLGIERALAAFAHEPNGGVIVTASTSSGAHRETIISLTMRYRLPAVYPFRYYTTDGGLASYGPDVIDIYRRAAAYVDRILKGEKPADLPVQAPTKYELVHLRTIRNALAMLAQKIK
jgi:putative ABC transport system substrate-binding protein